MLWGLQPEDAAYIIRNLRDAQVLSLRADETASSVLHHVSGTDNALLLCTAEVAVKLLGHGGDDIHGAIKSADFQTRRQRLLPRDQTLLALLHAGLSNKEIGRQIGVSERTVKGYLTRLFGIFEVTNRTELLGSAIDLGILRPRDHE